MIKLKSVLVTLVLVSTAGTIMITSSCKTRSMASTSCAGITPTYAADIKPILDANCASSCHSAEKHTHNINLSAYPTVKEISGKAAFLGAIRHEPHYTPMPKNHPMLDSGTIQKIACWVQNGSPQ